MPDLRRVLPLLLAIPFLAGCAGGPGAPIERPPVAVQPDVSAGEQPSEVADLVRRFDSSARTVEQIMALDDEDFDIVRRLVRRHRDFTRSEKADDVLRKWDKLAPKFVKVFPKDYKRAQSERIAAESGNG